LLGGTGHVGVSVVAQIFNDLDCTSINKSPPDLAVSSEVDGYPQRVGHQIRIPLAQYTKHLVHTTVQMDDRLASVINGKILEGLKEVTLKWLNKKNWRPKRFKRD